MEFNLDEFVAQPSLDKLNRCTKKHLTILADYFGITVPKQAKKQVIESELLEALSRKGVLLRDPGVLTMSSPAGQQDLGEQLRLKELDVEMRHLAIKEKELSIKIKEKELENELELRKMEIEGQLRLKELELKQSFSPMVSQFQSGEFNVNRCIRLIPPFREKDVDKYFILFERVANTLKWPKNVWLLLLQCVFTGKAQEMHPYRLN